MHVRYLRIYIGYIEKSVFFLRGWMLEVQLPKLLCFSRYAGMLGFKERCFWIFVAIVKKQKFQFTFWKTFWLVCGSMNRRAEQCDHGATHCNIPMKEWHVCNTIRSISKSWYMQPNVPLFWHLVLTYGIRKSVLRFCGPIGRKTQ